MSRPLIATKLYVPKLRRGLVMRPRLTAQLRRGAEAKLTLLSAPAGFGKTTLLTDWLSQTPDDERSIAWLSLDPEDGDPAAFWTFVVTALQGAVPGVGSDALELIASSSSAPAQLLTTLLNELAASSGEVWLVLDDYHLVDSHEIGQGMTFLLDHLPPRVHVVLSTRADPDLPLARWRVSGELVEIRAADLRFTSGEADAYLNEVTGLQLTAGDVEALEDRTEGWIAALQLAALSLRGHDDASGFIARFAGNDRYVVDYLIEEVLEHQPGPVRDFLLHTAVLDRLTAPLCDALTGRDDGRHLLATLERGNLFLTALDDQREWYRYHHLFADVLRARLLAEQPAQVPLLHQRASQWYERHGRTEESVRHALAARDFDRATRLIELAVSTIRRHRQEATMYGWLKALPDDAVRRSPVLNVFYGSMLLHAGDLDGLAERLDAAQRTLAAVRPDLPLPWADTEDLHTLPATIAIYRASLAQARGDAAGTAEHAQRALDLAGPEDHVVRGGGAGFLGLAAWAQGDVARALETFTQAVVSLHAAGSLVDELSGTVILANLWRLAGRPSKARRLCAQALEVAETRGAPMARAAAELHVGLSEIAIEAGELESAKLHLESSAAFADRAAMTESHYRWFVARGLLAQADGDPEAAVKLLDQAEQLYRPGFYPEVRPIPAMKARIWIARGHLAEAADWARERGVSTDDDAGYLREFDHLTLVRLRLAQYRAQPDTDGADQAGALLARLSDHAEESGRAGSLLEIRMLQALSAHAQGQQRQAGETLARALALAPEPVAYVRLFLNEGAPMIALLRDAAHHGVAGDHPRRLLGLEPGAPDPGPHRAIWPVGPLSDRELQVLRLLDGELAGPQIARQLFISPNTLRSHLKHIFTKLDVTSRRAAVRRAHELGVI